MTDTTWISAVDRSSGTKSQSVASTHQAWDLTMGLASPLRQRCDSELEHLGKQLKPPTYLSDIDDNADINSIGRKGFNVYIFTLRFDATARLCSETRMGYEYSRSMAAAMRGC